MNNLEKLITNLSNYWDISPDKVVDRLNFMNEQEINKIVDKMTKKFKNGGLIDCLRNGGEFSKCMKCGGNMVRKGAIGMNTEVPPTGTASAYIGTYPEFNPSDSTWTQKDGRYIKNAFSGNDLYQNIVTYGEYGTPRRSVRIIKNFRTPDADTSRVDGFGKIASDNPGLIERIFGTPFTKQFKGAQDKILEGMDPKYSSEKEVRSSQKKANGGELKKKMSTPPKKKQDLLKTKK